jgi:hypothetical protein
MIQVYHHDFETRTDALVAEVLTDSLESAYHMTQNLNGSWSKTRLVFDDNDRLVKNPDFHPEVQVMAPLHVVNGREYGLRSSMMGDVMVKNGKKYRVAMVGFKEVA